ncbi:hypothetical protein BY458DRAFT_438169, partial [Sporodiniella umbellata]
LPDNCLRPVTVKQINEAKADNVRHVYVIDQTPCSGITFVGRINALRERSSTTIYQIEDGSGSILIKQKFDIFESSEEKYERRLIEKDMYVRVHGRIKYFISHMCVLVSKIVPVVEFNELTYHYLSAISIHLKITRSNKTAIVSNGRDTINLVWNILKEKKYLPEGISIYYIVDQLKSVCSKKEILLAVHEITKKGECFTTIDSNHYRLCD